MESCEDAQSKIHQHHFIVGMTNSAPDLMPARRPQQMESCEDAQSKIHQHHFIVGMTNSAPDLMPAVRPQQIESCEDAQSKIHQASLHCWHNELGARLDA